MKLMGSGGPTRARARFAGVAFVAALSTASIVPAANAVTVGQLPASIPTENCSGDIDRGQLTVSDGNSYIVPSTGGVSNWTITSWSHFAKAGNEGQQLTMKVFRKVAEPLTYLAVAQDGPRPLTPGVINTFQTSIEVKAGDIIGNNGLSSPSSACIITDATPGNEYIRRDPGLPVGQTGDYVTQTGFKINVSAEVTPTNTFAQGQVRRNKKKGTATISFTVPNPGQLAGSGGGAKVAGVTGATISKSVAAGTAKLVVKAKKKKRAKLNDTGKVKVKPTITYQPTGGTTRSLKIKVKLKKKV